MSSIYLRGKTWRAEVRRGSFYSSESFPTKAAAKAWALSVEAEYQAGRLGEVADKTLGEVFARYALEVSPRKAGYKWEALRLASFQRDPISKRKLANLDASVFAAWRDARLSSVSGSTVAREMTLMRSSLEIARKEWLWLRANPMADVAKPQENKPRARRVLPSEAQAIAKALRWAEGPNPSTTSQQTAVAFLLAIETGMRAGEIRALRPGHLHLDKGYVVVANSKNGDSRNVALTDRAIELLRLALPELFPMTDKTLDATFRRGVKKTGIVDITFHDSRHEACTQLAKKLTVLELARHIGHRDLKSLMVYFNPTAEELSAKLRG